MALPKLNNIPMYDIIIPSTNKSVRFRPYLVKEEKVLMMAFETNDQRQVLSAIIDTIVSCIEGDINSNLLTTFDVEYLFINIRSKSVGETVKVNIPCDKCETPNEYSINLEDIKINVPDVNKTIEITSDLNITMKWPRYQVMLNEDIVSAKTVTDQTFNMLVECIESVNTSEERFDFASETTEEKMAFVESLNSEQFEKIKNFVEQMPSLNHNVDFSCTKCNHNNIKTLQGLTDFFS